MREVPRNLFRMSALPLPLSPLQHLTNPPLSATVTQQEHVLCPQAQA